jgi:hypothetical protein
MIVVFNDMMKSISIFLGSTPTLHPADDVVEVVRGSSKYRPHTRVLIDYLLVWMTPAVHTTSAATVIASPDPPARNFLMLRASTLVR